ncbi:MAG: hypothetical protein Q9191_000925 [Dirinaria sp. TL-2023a]
MAAIQMHRPTPSVSIDSLDQIPATHDFRGWRLRRVGAEKSIITNDPRQFRFGNALSNLEKFRMPTGKRTQEWLDQADRARKSLSSFWSRARENYKKTYRALDIDRENTEAIVQLLSYHDSHEVRAMVAKERQEITMEIARHPKPPSQYQSSIPHLPASKDKPDKVPIAALEAKAKLKMRPSDHAANAESQKPPRLEPIAPFELLHPGQRLPLPKKMRSLDTLRLLFPSATSDLQSTIQWTDFVGTMSELGFHGEHRGGSEWTIQSMGVCQSPVAESSKQNSEQTEQEKVHNKRSIVIHQPHPVQKMGTLRLQQIGKRLWRRFVWQRESFQGL